MITLYHGSNIAIEHIDLLMGHINKDFGQGFYLTDIKAQAEAMAKKRVELAKLDEGEAGTPIVTEFLFDETLLHSAILKVKTFSKPTAEWAEFIAQNRRASITHFRHDYDIIVGPIANDSVFDQLRRYMQGYITAAELAKELQYAKLNNQYYFGTTRAIQCLQKL